MNTSSSTEIQLKKNISESYKRIDEKYRALNEKGALMYGTCFKEIFVDIVYVDFYFGDVVCSFDGSYEVSQDLFEMNHSIENVEVFEISTTLLRTLINHCYKAYNDLSNSQIELLDDSNSNINDILNEMRGFVNSLVEGSRKNTISQKLIYAFKKFYIFLDLFLYDDYEHIELRSFCCDFLEVQSIEYDNISVNRNKLNELETIEGENYEVVEKSYNVEANIEPSYEENTRNNEPTIFGKLFRGRYRTNLKRFYSYIDRIVAEADASSSTPACMPYIKPKLEAMVKKSKGQIRSWDDHTNIELIAVKILYNICFDKLVSGEMHIYAGMLNPLEPADKLRYIIEYCLDYYIAHGITDMKEKKEQLKYLYELISQVG